MVSVVILDMTEMECSFAWKDNEGSDIFLLFNRLNCINSVFYVVQFSIVFNVT